MHRSPSRARPDRWCGRRRAGWSFPYVDVTRRPQVVASDEPGGKRARTLVWDLVPRRTCEQDGMQADAAVGRGDDVAAVLPPGGDDAVERPRVEVGPVGEDDERRLDLVGEGREPATER